MLFNSTLCLEHSFAGEKTKHSLETCYFVVYYKRSDRKKEKTTLIIISTNVMIGQQNINKKL